jgi:hypothetical protein
MNRFRPLATRACLEDLSAPISHFAGCRQDHDFMYRQLAQTRHREPQMDPNFWSRTENVWAGTSARTRASFMQLATGIYGRCAAATLVILLVVGVQLMPAATKLATPTAQGTAPASEQITVKNASQQKTEDSAASNRASKSSKTTAATGDATQNAPAAPVQSASATTPATAPESTTPTPQTPTEPTTPNSTPKPQPNPETPEQPQTGTNVAITPEGASVSLLTDEDPAVEVSLPGVNLGIL